jgi:hypothetical protein
MRFMYIVTSPKPAIGPTPEMQRLSRRYPSGRSRPAAWSTMAA